MEKRKYIVIVLDSFDLHKDMWIGDEVFCYSYEDTEIAINNRLDNIVTYSLVNISFDLINMGYEIYVVNKDVCKHMYPGMPIKCEKEIRFGHNIRKLIVAGALDEDLKITRK